MMILIMRKISDWSCRKSKLRFLFSNMFAKIVTFMKQCGKMSQSQTSHRWQI